MEKTLIQKRKVRRQLARILMIITLMILCVWGVSPWYILAINSTESVRGTFFLIIKDEIPKKGELIAFWPPKNPYYQNIWFVKYLAATEGDVIEVNGQDFYINGEYLATAKTHTRHGHLLQPSAGGVIPSHYYFVWTDHPDSFDSRYQHIGWIHKNEVIGRAIRLF